MIALVRVDSRLIHGQVVETWLPALKVSRILVADDCAAASALTRAAMGLAVPPPVKVEIAPLASADFAGAAASPERVLVLFRDVDAVLRARELGLSFGVETLPATCPGSTSPGSRSPVLNLGNVHHAPGRVQVTASVFLSPAELVGLRSLAAAGVTIEVRAIPRDKPLGMNEIEARLAG